MSDLSRRSFVVAGSAWAAGLLAHRTASGAPPAAAPTRVTIRADRARQEFQGLGCGVMFYEGHVTSLAARQKDARQKELYDDMFAKVPARYLHLMIRPTHEPKNDNADPWTPAFDPADFKYCAHTLAIAKAAKERRPDIELLATLTTPPAWMKTNDAEGGGGKAKATLKPGLGLEFAEYIWAFLAQMARGGAAVKYVAISNEPDWPHEQPGCFFTADAHAEVFRIVGEYLEKMAAKHADVPRAILVGPNTLSAPGAAATYVPAMMKRAGKYVGPIASHDYDMRGDRWGDLRRLAGARPVWMTEWCSREADESPGQINSGTEYARAMHEAFGGGANVWMAYDWVYPPRKGGEALIHVDWGKDYELKKSYWVFRQWATPLRPGMRVVEASAAGSAAVRPTAFVAADGRSLVVHVVNTGAAEARVALAVTGWRTGGAAVVAGPAARRRTSATEDMVELAPLPVAAGVGYADLLPGRSVTTYQFAPK
jgi:O-glycosyl hydrolase